MNTTAQTMYTKTVTAIKLRAENDRKVLEAEYGKVIDKMNTVSSMGKFEVALDLSEKCVGELLKNGFKVTEVEDKNRAIGDYYKYLISWNIIQGNIK